MMASDKNLRILFHYPGPLYQEQNTGEKIRPKKILSAIMALGHECTVVTGDYRERKKLIQQIIKKNQSFDLMYSENSNLPLRLCNANKLPKINCCDFQLWKYISQKKIPIGVFIRDIYWKMGVSFAHQSAWKTKLARSFYEEEIKLYGNLAKRIFVPTATFAKYLPDKLQTKSFPLPPAANEILQIETKKLEHKTQLIYVGSCMPPTYDIISTIKELNQIKSCHITIITRQRDQIYLKNQIELEPHIQLVTAEGKELEPYLKKAHIGLACVEETPYWNLAMHVKSFEYASYHLPILTYSFGETSALVDQNQIGWSIKSPQMLKEFLANLNNDQYQKKVKAIESFLPINLWENRIETIIQQLWRN